MVVGIVLLIACSNVANSAACALSRPATGDGGPSGHGSKPREGWCANSSPRAFSLDSSAAWLGCLIGYAGLQLLCRSGLSDRPANFMTPKLDATVFVFALVVSLVTGFLFGTIPAFKASRASVAETLKEEARTTGRSRRRITLANALLVGQVAFSFLLLVTAALFLRSIRRAYDIDPGFQTAHLAVFLTNPGQAGYGKPQTKAFYKDVRERVARHSRCRVRILGFEHAALGASRVDCRWKATSTIASRQNHN